MSSAKSAGSSTGRCLTRTRRFSWFSTPLPGQNAVNRPGVRNAAGITGIVLTKLDGTARGGVVLTIREELDVPVKFIGVGEGVDDLMPFDPDDFAHGLFGDAR